MFRVRNPLYHRVILLVLIIFLAWPLPARADGGPIVNDPLLWAQLKEGQQIAVITLKDTKAADVDLFISLLDKSGESHEVVFFVPLGKNATNFIVIERTSLNFDQNLTKGLDGILRQNAERKHETVRSLFAGTLLINGVWLLPLWLPVLLTGCGAPVPEATFETDSSQVSIFGLSDDTDLEALISTTGLDPSVRGTLSRLRGQQIAVVNLHTQPLGTGDSSESSPAGEPGIHLSWATSLIPREDGAAYSYPLGTGDSWSHPIELTRIYVVAPPGIDFTVRYPELGAEYSGYIQEYRSHRPRIADYYQVPAHAADDAIGDFGRVWRATYTQSNSADDIIIVARPQSLLSRIDAKFQQAGGIIAFLFGLAVAVVFWILAWRYLMPRLLGEGYKGSISTLRRYALSYIGLNFVLFIPGVIIYLFWSFSADYALAFVILFIVFGGANILFFVSKDLGRLGVSKGLALKAYAKVTLASNGAYLLFAIAYLKLTGVI